MAGSEIPGVTSVEQSGTARSIMADSRSVRQSRGHDESQAMVVVAPWWTRGGNGRRGQGHRDRGICLLETWKVGFFEALMFKCCHALLSGSAGQVTQLPGQGEMELSCRCLDAVASMAFVGEHQSRNRVGRAGRSLLCVAISSPCSSCLITPYLNRATSPG